MGYCFSTDIKSAITNMIPGHMLYALAHAVTEDTLFSVIPSVVVNPKRKEKKKELSNNFVIALQRTFNSDLLTSCGSKRQKKKKPVKCNLW